MYAHRELRIELRRMVVEHLIANGLMRCWLLNESRFTDVAPSGLEQVFTRCAKSADDHHRPEHPDLTLAAIQMAASNLAARRSGP